MSQLMRLRNLYRLGEALHIGERRLAAKTLQNRPRFFHKPGTQK